MQQSLFRRVIFGLVWFYGISTIVGYLMPNPVFTYISNIWFTNTFCRYTRLNDQTTLFQAIQFSMSLFALILNIKQFYLTRWEDPYMCSTAGHSGPVCDGNEGVLRIPQSSSVTGVSPSDFLSRTLVVVILPLCREAVGVFYSPSWLGWVLLDLIDWLIDFNDMSTCLELFCA